MISTKKKSYVRTIRYIGKACNLSVANMKRMARRIAKLDSIVRVSCLMVHIILISVVRLFMIVTLPITCYYV